MAEHSFLVPWVNNPGCHVKFGRGQPFRYLSSWPLTPCDGVDVCRELICIPVRSLTGRYALLGDDFVIADEAVAKVYLPEFKWFEIPVSLHKSLVSKKGSFEFAKRSL